MPDNDKLRVELDAIKGDLHALRDDLGSVVKVMRKQGSAKVDSVGKQVREETMHRYNQLRDVLDNAKGTGRRYYFKAQRKVEERPLASIMVAFGVGLIVGKLFGLGRR